MVVAIKSCRHIGKFSGVVRFLDVKKTFFTAHECSLYCELLGKKGSCLVGDIFERILVFFMQFFLVSFISSHFFLARNFSVGVCYCIQ